MKLFPALEKKYSEETLTASEALRLAHRISFGPVVFQVSRIMLKFGILQMLADSAKGMTSDEIAGQTELSRYAAQVLLESSLTIGLVKQANDRFVISKTGWFLLSDPLIKVNMDFNHDVNYLGWFRLEEALLNGTPEGLKVFGNWATIYEGLSQLPGNVQKSWFGFDHYYSDESFDEALQIVFNRPVKTLLDVGGNTGRWALRCVSHNPEVSVTVMDLPQQLEMMKRQTAGKAGADRITAYAANVLDKTSRFPTGYDVIWMSQFLDCFPENEIKNILSRAAQSMNAHSRLYIMETFWDRQAFEDAAFCLTQISLYFTALANGNSKMYHSGDMIRCVNGAGLQIEQMHDGLGKGHSLLICRI
ncbi:MAG: methyltransferase domain-containing protein [Dysgonamonadaceae bacterium]|jgi:hypothetical protein|nr:methyltransferase domain-containing protein [Dysgonamonadaceae bacterium]